MKKRNRRARKREEVLEILKQFRTSGLSQVAFSRQRDLAVSTLQFWLRKERNGEATTRRGTRARKPAGQLVPVKIVDTHPELDPALLEFELSGGGKLRFSTALPPEALVRYAEALGHRC